MKTLAAVLLATSLGALAIPIALRRNPDMIGDFRVDVARWTEPAPRAADYQHMMVAPADPITVPIRRDEIAVVRRVG